MRCGQRERERGSGTGGRQIAALGGGGGVKVLLGKRKKKKGGGSREPERIEGAAMQPSQTP